MASTTVTDNRVAIRRLPAASYPEFPYDPPSVYPELSRLCVSYDECNSVYGAFRDVLIDLQLDRHHLGQPSWNPFREFLAPGQRAVIKPNWVLDSNQADDSIESLITHTSLVRAAIDYLILALGHHGTIEIADAPLQSCDFDRLLYRTQVLQLIHRYRADYPGVTFSVFDLRKTILHTHASPNGDTVKQTHRRGDPRGYSMVDLRSDSLLADIQDRYSRFRVANYDHRIMREHHNNTTHEYLLSNTILTADFIFNIPKLKFHIKAGVTGALKNLVGINGHKEYLPHHTNGSPFSGGDQYPRRSFLKPLVNLIYDRYWARVACSRRHPSLHQVAVRAAKKASSIVEGDRMFDGAWPGNDTIPRTTIDLNNAFYFYDTGRQALSEIQQRTAFHLVDGVIAGDGYGPLRPSSALTCALIGGWNPVGVDLCAARLIGLEPEKVPLLRHVLNHRKSRFSCTSDFASTIRLTDQGLRKRFSDLERMQFRIPVEWFDARS